MGHTDASYSDTTFRNHLLGGISTAAGAQAADCGPPAPAGTFNRVTLAKGVASVGEPMGLTVLPDRSVLHTSRDGVIRLTTATGSTKVAATIPVYTHDEEGLQSIKVDPNFATNRWVYIYYAPPLNPPQVMLQKRGRPRRSRRTTASTGSAGSRCGPTAPSTWPVR